MSYIEKQVPYKEDGVWVQLQYTYADQSMTGHPINVNKATLTEEQVSTHFPDLITPEKPETKIFDTGYIHLQFDPESVEYKNFSADSRTREFFNNQEVTISKVGIEFRKKVINALYADSVISEGTKNKVLAVFNLWSQGLKD